MIMLTPVQTRAQDADLVNQCRLANPSAGSGQALKTRLPLPWPMPPETPPSPKKRYRSRYQYRGYEKLDNSAAWAYLSPFEIALYLIDFSGLRPVLAQQLGWHTARGQIPFDPVSPVSAVWLAGNQPMESRPDTQEFVRSPLRRPGDHLRL